MNIREQLRNIEIPETFRCTTGGEEELAIVRYKDEFFATVRRALGLASLRADCLFEEKTYLLMGAYPGHESDDKSWMLSWGGDEQLAMVHDTRSNANAHSVVCMVNSSPSETLCEDLAYQATLQAAIETGQELPEHPALKRQRDYLLGMRTDPL